MIRILTTVTVPVILLLVVTITGCSNQTTATVGVLSAEEYLENKLDGAVLLDVRTPAEFAEGHLTDAVNIDFRAPDFQNKIAELDHNKTYYLYCRTGNRSGQAGTLMNEMGFTSLYNIGGLAELEKAGAVVVR